MVKEERKQVFKGCWVTAHDVPPFLIIKEFIASLPDWSGGLLDGEVELSSLNWLEEFSFRAKDIA